MCRWRPFWRFTRGKTVPVRCSSLKQAYDEEVASLNDDAPDAGSEIGSVMSVIDGDRPDREEDDNPDDDPPPPRGGRPALRVVK
jgi:stringent starvation protein B